jgi:hypothetical protein
MMACHLCARNHDEEPHGVPEVVSMRSIRGGFFSVWPAMCRSCVLTDYTGRSARLRKLNPPRIKRIARSYVQRSTDRKTQSRCQDLCWLPGGLTLLGWLCLFSPSRISSFGPQSSQVAELEVFFATNVLSSPLLSNKILIVIASDWFRCPSHETCTKLINVHVPWL